MRPVQRQAAVVRTVYEVCTHSCIANRYIADHDHIIRAGQATVQDRIGQRQSSRCHIDLLVRTRDTDLSISQRHGSIHGHTARARQISADRTARQRRRSYRHIARHRAVIEQIQAAERHFSGHFGIIQDQIAVIVAADIAADIEILDSQIDIGQGFFAPIQNISLSFSSGIGQCHRRSAADRSKQRIAGNITVIPADHRIAVIHNRDTLGQRAVRIDRDFGNIRSSRIHCHGRIGPVIDRSSVQLQIRTVQQSHTAGQHRTCQRDIRIISVRRDPAGYRYCSIDCYRTRTDHRSADFGSIIERHAASGNIKIHSAGQHRSVQRQTGCSSVYKVRTHGCIGYRYGAFHTHRIGRAGQGSVQVRILQYQRPHSISYRDCTVDLSKIRGTRSLQRYGADTHGRSVHGAEVAGDRTGRQSRAFCCDIALQITAGQGEQLFRGHTDAHTHRVASGFNHYIGSLQLSGYRTIGQQHIRRSHIAGQCSGRQSEITARIDSAVDRHCAAVHHHIAVACQASGDFSGSQRCRRRYAHIAVQLSGCQFECAAVDRAGSGFSSGCRHRHCSVGGFLHRSARGKAALDRSGFQRRIDRFHIARQTCIAAQCQLAACIIERHIAVHRHAAQRQLAVVRSVDEACDHIPGRDRHRSFYFRRIRAAEIAGDRTVYQRRAFSFNIAHQITAGQSEQPVRGQPLGHGHCIAFGFNRYIGSLQLSGYLSFGQRRRRCGHIAFQFAARQLEQSIRNYSAGHGLLSASGIHGYRCGRHFGRYGTALQRHAASGIIKIHSAGQRRSVQRQIAGRSSVYESFAGRKFSRYCIYRHRSFYRDVIRAGQVIVQVRILQRQQSRILYHDHAVDCRKMFGIRSLQRHCFFHSRSVRAAEIARDRTVCQRRGINCHNAVHRTILQF